MSKGLYDIALERATRQPPKPEPSMPEDWRRVTLNNLAIVKKWFPKDWRRLVEEINNAKAA
jgi:hypothetical protein